MDQLLHSHSCSQSSSFIISLHAYLSFCSLWKTNYTHFLGSFFTSCQLFNIACWICNVPMFPCRVLRRAECNTNLFSNVFLQLRDTDELFFDEVLKEPIKKNKSLGMVFLPMLQIKLEEKCLPCRFLAHSFSTV